MADPKFQKPSVKEVEVEVAAPSAKVKPKTVKVVTSYPFVIDLITDTKITATPVEIEVHPWLELQIAANIIQVV